MARNHGLPSSSRSHLKQQASATQESGGHESVAFALRSRALAGVNGEAPTRHILDRRVQVAYGLTTSVRVHDPAEQPCAGARFKEMCSCTTSLDAHVRALDAGLPPARRTTGSRYERSARPRQCPARSRRSETASFHHRCDCSASRWFRSVAKRPALPSHANRHQSRRRLCLLWPARALDRQSALRPSPAFRRFPCTDPAS